MAQTGTGGAELELRDYLRVVWRGRWIILISTIVMVGATFGLSASQEPVYEASSVFLLESRVSDSAGAGRSSQESTQTEVQVLQSPPVRALVEEELGEAGTVEAEPVSGGQTIRVTAEANSPELAAATANAYVNAYSRYRLQQGVDELSRVSTEIQTKIDELEAELVPLDEELAGASALNLPVVQSQQEGKRSQLNAQIGAFRTQLGQVQLGQGLSTAGAEVLSVATPPESPSKPLPVRNALVALPVGLVLGLGLAFFFEYLDDSIKSKSDLERSLGPGLPILGLIPRMSWRDRTRAQLVAVDEPNSPASEAYRSLRTSVQFLGMDEPIDCLQVTSASAAEGKSTTIANLAVVLARAGERKVVVVDCDLRRPRLHEFFDLPNTVGFTSVLLGEVPLSSALQSIGEEKGLSVLTSGPVPAQPSELLASRRAGEVLAALRSEGALVLIDSPPILPVTDALVVSRWASATLLVSAAGTTTKKQVHRALELLNQVEAPLAGSVLNQATVDGSGYGYAGRYYGGDRVDEMATPKSRSTRVAQKVIVRS